MNKLKLIMMAALLIVFALAIAGCNNGGGAADTSSASPSAGPAGAEPGMGGPAASGDPTASAAATPAATPAAPAGGAPAAPLDVASTPAPAGAASSTPSADEKLSLQQMISPAKIKTKSMKSWDGQVFKYLTFNYKNPQGIVFPVELPVEFKAEKMTRSDWADMFIAYCDIPDRTAEGVNMVVTYIELKAAAQSGALRN